MRNHVSNILWGVLLVVLGVALLGDTMDWWRFDLFFDGWWTLFIIVPCAASLLQSGVHFGNTAGLLLGVLLLVEAQDWFSINIYRLILPAGLVVAGIALLFRRRYYGQSAPGPQGPFEKTPAGSAASGSASGPQDPFEKPPAGSAYGQSAPGNAAYSRRWAGPNAHPFALLSSSEARFTGCEFHGGSVTAVLGGAELDLRGAIITGDVTVAATAVLGGVEVFVDDRVQVRYSSVPLLGGVSCAVNAARDPALPTVFVNSVAVLGGVDIQ